MDLGFIRFDTAFSRDVALTQLPPDLAVLLVTVTARQAASPTAMVAARCVNDALDPTLFAPLDGAFNGRVADLLLKWKEE